MIITQPKPIFSLEEIPLLMKNLFCFILISILPSLVLAQSKINEVGDNATFEDLIYTNEINGLDVFNSDTFNQMIRIELEKKQSFVNDKAVYSKVYFTNKSGDKYLTVWGGSDLGYGWFYTIGYTGKGKCTDCGTYIRRELAVDFTINHGIKLGDSIKQVWGKVYLNYFRKFMYNGIVYYYFEKGVKHKVPFTPNQVFYYKFKDDTLIEIGFGYGMIGINPMLHP